MLGACTSWAMMPYACTRCEQSRPGRSTNAFQLDACCPQVLTVTPNHILYRAAGTDNSTASSFAARKATAAGGLQVPFLFLRASVCCSEAETHTLPHDSAAALVACWRNGTGTMHALPVLTSGLCSQHSWCAVRDVALPLWFQVGDQLYVQLPGATAVVTSAIISIQPLVLPTAFNAHTVQGAQAAMRRCLSVVPYADTATYHTAISPSATQPSCCCWHSLIGILPHNSHCRKHRGGRRGGLQLRHRRPSAGGGHLCR
jgi:hypothetical protein